MISISLEIEMRDESVEFKQGTGFVHMADDVQTARQMLKRIAADAEAWFTARDRPPDPRGK